jgi:hypothetical protein
MSGSKVETGKLIALSTGHLTQEETETPREDWPGTMWNGEYGMFVSLCMLGGEGGAPCPDEWPGLARIVAWVADNCPEVEYLLFDCDADPIEGVEVYDW